MEIKDKNTAIIYNLLLPGAGDIYVEKNSATKGILTAGIITTLISIGIFYNIYQEYDRYHYTVIGARDILYGTSRSTIYLGLGFMLFLCFIVPRIVFTFEVIGRVLNFNNRLGPIKTQNFKINTNNNQSNSIVITDIEKSMSENFISDLTKVYNLKVNGVYTEEDYKKRKLDIIFNLINNGITENVEDLLVNMIPLKEKGILNLEEINQIKLSLIFKEKHNNINYNKKEETNNENISSNLFEPGLDSNLEKKYFCVKCNTELKLTPEEIKEKIFICKDCYNLRKNMTIM